MAGFSLKISLPKEASSASFGMNETLMEGQLWPVF
jgi:hypothetical protein